MWAHHTRVCRFEQGSHAPGQGGRRGINQVSFVGLLDIGKPKAGDTVFVSAAAGAVGMVVCQIAKLKGCRVVGSAGSAAKVQWLRDVAGIDVPLHYKEVTSLVYCL